MKTILSILYGLLLLAAPAAAQQQKQDKKSAARPFVLGEIREIHSGHLSEKRILNIYLPAGYQAGDTTRYPVIYLLDGSAGEDFIHICGLVQFFNMMALMPKTIVVGIANVDRKRDFTYPTTVAADKKEFPSTGGSARFIAFIEKELQPYINARYHTGPERIIIGQSLGGLVATEILLKKPELFTHYIIVSPSLWWDNGSLLALQLPSRNGNADISPAVYIAVGKEGSVMEGDAKQLAELLKSRETAPEKIYFEYLPEENHATILHQAVYRAFRTLFPAAPGQ